MAQISDTDIITMAKRFESCNKAISQFGVTLREIWEINPVIKSQLDKFERKPSYQKWLLRRWYFILDLYDKGRELCHR